MRVAIVVPFSWSFPGGVVAHADGQARALRELGTEALVLCGYDPPGLNGTVPNGKPRRRERPPGHVVPLGRSVPVPANRSTANVVLSPLAARRLVEALGRRRFDVVHVHDPLSPVLPVAALATARCPIVATCHSSGSRWAALGSRTWGLLMRRIAHRIAVSEQARAAASRYLPGPIEVLPNGVDLPVGSVSTNRLNRVVFVGRTDGRKGLDTLLRAWPAVRHATGARLRLVGVHRSEAQQRLERLGRPADGVDALGVVSDEVVVNELESAKVLAAPSNGAESFGIVLIQAFASGTPVVCSDIQGFRDVAHPAASIRVRPGDPDALRDALLMVLCDPSLHLRLTANARRSAEPYAWPRIAARLLQIYESLE